MNRLLPYIKLLIGWPLSIIAILFITKFLLDNYSRISGRFGEIKIEFLFLSILLFFLYYFLRGFLWKQILESKEQKVNFFENLYRYEVSELKRFVPGNIWSFLSRGVQFSELGVDKKIVGVSILMEIQLVLSGSFLFSLLCFPLILNDAVLREKIIALIPLSLTVAAIFFIATAYLYHKKYDKNMTLIKSIYLPGVSIASKIKLTLISTFTFIIFGLANYLIYASSFGFSIENLIYLSSFFTFALLVGYLSFFTPMGLGVREGVIILGLSKGIGTINSSFFAIFSRVVLIISELSYLLLLLLIKIIFRLR